MVFPTCVGVFPGPCMSVPLTAGLPHVRGGVSCGYGVGWRKYASSPRAWGCFYLCECSKCGALVFPTCVGVFPCPRRFQAQSISLPHVRGGVSPRHMDSWVDIASSPRAWGCFQLAASITAHGRVFPTCVGVFLFLLTGFSESPSLPHVRGGVSGHL